MGDPTTQEGADIYGLGSLYAILPYLAGVLAQNTQAGLLQNITGTLTEGYAGKNQLRNTLMSQAPWTSTAQSQIHSPYYRGQQEAMNLRALQQLRDWWNAGTGMPTQGIPGTMSGSPALGAHNPTAGYVQNVFNAMSNWMGGKRPQNYSEWLDYNRAKAMAFQNAQAAPDPREADPVAQPVVDLLKQMFAPAPNDGQYATRYGARSTMPTAQTAWWKS